MTSMTNAAPVPPHGTGAAVPADASNRSANNDEQERLAVLVSRSACGDEAAFAEFYDALAARVYGLSRRILQDPAQAQEVAQEAFFDVWRTCATYDPSRASVAGWVMTITHRRAVDRVRAVQADRRRTDEYGQRTQDRPHDTTSAQVEIDLEHEQVAGALAQLSAPQREALELAFIHGHTHTEVARLLDLPLGTTKSRIRDGLKRLHIMLEGGT